LALNLQDALTWGNSAEFTGTQPILSDEKVYPTRSFLANITK
jgi:hypothetical protein